MMDAIMNTGRRGSCFVRYRIVFVYELGCSCLSPSYHHTSPSSFSDPLLPLTSPSLATSPMLFGTFFKAAVGISSSPGSQSKSRSSTRLVEPGGIRVKMDVPVAMSRFSGAQSHPRPPGLAFWVWQTRCLFSLSCGAHLTLKVLIVGDPPDGISAVGVRQRLRWTTRTTSSKQPRSLSGLKVSQNLHKCSSNREGFG